jgi:hypothetical protein
MKMKHLKISRLFEDSFVHLKLLEAFEDEDEDEDLKIKSF